MNISLCLSNSPSVFQTYINDVLRDMLNRWVIVYIDDILIFSESLKAHIHQVRAVLKRLIEHQLYAKKEKCEFHQTRVSFLGYIISADGVAMDNSKVQSVLNWPQPTTVKELQRFLGFANFYRRFIRNFSTIAAPLTSLLKGGRQRLDWSPSAQNAFQRLKNRFTTAPILHHPDQEFIVEVDASNTGIGAILSQRQGSPPKLFPCAYCLRKLNSAERNYDVGDHELLAMKAAFEEWRHWLEGAKFPFTVLTDHRNLEYIRSAKRLNPRQARWSLFFSRFEFKVTYRPGSKNCKADALSRLHDSSTPLNSNNESIISPTLVVAPVQWDIHTEITEAQANDPIPPNCPNDRTYVPHNLRQRVLHLVHDSSSSGHPGITASLQLVSECFWWPSLRTDTIAFVQPATWPNHLTSDLLGYYNPCQFLSVSYCHWLCHWPPQLQEVYHHSDRHWPLLQSMPPHTLAQVTHSFRDCWGPIASGLSLVWTPRRHCFRSGPAIQVTCLEFPLSTTQHQRQSHLRLSSRVQQSSRKTQSRNHPFPKIILPSKPERLESIPGVGWIRPELTPQTFNRPNPIPVRSWLSTTPVPLVGRTFWTPRS